MICLTFENEVKFQNIEKDKTFEKKHTLSTKFFFIRNRNSTIMSGLDHRTVQTFSFQRVKILLDHAGNVFVLMEYHHYVPLPMFIRHRYNLLSFAFFPDGRLVFKSQKEKKNQSNCK